MSCHLCENNAIGLCRQCYKFYCPAHGDGLCAECVADGWSIGSQQLTRQRLRMVRDNITARDKSVVVGESINIVADTPASKEKTKEVSAQTTTSAFSWHRDKRDLLQPSNFIGLLPATGSCKAKGIQLVLSGLELYQEAFAFTLQKRFAESSQHLLSPRDIALRDDVNTAYEITSTGGGSNSTGVSFQFFSITPALRPDAQELVIEIPYMEMHHHQAGHVEVLSLSGPWEIRVQLPPRDSVV